MSAKRRSTLATELAFGRYEHRSELGYGGSGRVVEVVDHGDAGALKALKIVTPEHAARLSWELEVLAATAHPSLARVHELLRVETPLGAPFRLPRGAWVLVEDRAPGEASSSVFAALDPVHRSALARTLATQLAGALDALHARGIAHGDVKPGNVVVDTAAERATLVDLGLAIPFGRGGTGGTPRFLAPEAFLGERSPATDLFALGATLHDWLTGARGEGSRSDVQLDARAPRSELPAWVDADLAVLVRTCLADDPAQRPRIAADVARALGASDVLVLLGAPSPIERARRATVLPIVGRAREVERVAKAITNALGADAPVAVLVAMRGPPGSGRTRVVLEAVRTAQMELARAGREAPSLLGYRAGMDVPRLPSVVFGAHDEDGVIALHRAARLSGAPVVVVIEREDAIEVADHDVVLRALGSVPCGELIAQLIDRPDAEVVERWRRSTHGMPGRLVRAFAERWTAGGDPRTGPPARDEGPSDPWLLPSGAARDLAVAAAIAGGAIDARTARRVVGRDVDRAVETLVARSLAEREADGSVRIADALVERAPSAVDGAEVRRVAAELVNALPRGLGRALAAWALGGTAVAELLAAVTALRDVGATERAAWVLARARAWADDARLVEAHVDALVAASRLDEAMQVLDRADPNAFTSLRGETLRRAGRFDEARAILERIDGPARASARASLARIAMTTGGAGPELDGDDASPFVEETRALLLAQRGQPEAGLAVASRAKERLASRADVPAFERARALARLAAVEASARSALGDAEGAHAAFEESARAADAAGERHASAAFLVNLGVGRLELGLLGPALDALTHGTERLVMLGREREAARALYNVANAALLAGDRSHARHAAEGALREANRVGDAEASALAEVVLADVDVGEGRVRAAERRLSALVARDGSALAAARLYGTRALTHDLAGARESLEVFAAQGDLPPPVRTELLLARARVEIALGDVHRARAIADEALQSLAGAGGFELRLRVLDLAVEVADARQDDVGLDRALRAMRTMLDRALASLPSERHAQFRALRPRALAWRPEDDAQPASDVVDLSSHARALLEEIRTSRVAERLAASAREIAGAEHAFLVVREADGTLAVRAACGEAGRLDPSSVRLSTTIVARCLDQRTPVVSIDAAADLSLGGGASIHALAVRSVIAIPLAFDARAAALYVDDRLRPSAFGRGVVRALTSLAAFASIAFANAARARRERQMQSAAIRRERSLRASLEEKTREAAQLARERPVGDELVAESASMRSVIALAARVAVSDVSTLISGESGTGKELIARFVHRTSARAAAPFVAESCAAIPAALLESALFGHVRGAFSGAIGRKRGLFELADGGTLFLDEIGEMPLAMQAKLLRVLSAREVRPIGSERARAIDVRVIAATHRDLRALVQSGAFREDLFYRIAVVEIALPPLRDRPDDVEPLVRRFVGTAATEPAAMAALRAHEWPGNVRELENEVRRALALDPAVLRMENLSTRVRGEDVVALDDLDIKRATEHLERRLLERALSRAGHNVTQAAKLLGLSRFGLQKMMSRHRIGRAMR
jgi:transcriptional regulator with GAF, ATPase, and Fis domain